MKRTLKRAIALALSTVLMVGMCVTVVSAFTYPSAYWKVHDSWAQAVAAENADQVLSLAQQTYDLLMQYELCSDICYNLEPKCAKASWCAEMKGDIDGAILWLERQKVFAQWLNQNEHSYKDTLLNIDARMEYLNASQSMEIYGLTNQGGKTFPHSGASNGSTLYGSTVDGTYENASAVLMYVTFGDSYSVEYWIDYYKNTSPNFKKAAEEGGVIELAWNFVPESTAGAQAVLSADSYISESLAAMGNLNATVLLRVGAEMNNWSDCDPAIFKQAFQKVAQQARQYGNIKMVFSPDNVSNRNVTFEDFYPGDEYVDWIGVSTYHNTNYSGETTAYQFNAAGYENDAYYGVGLYDSDPLVILRPLVRFAQAHNKPMMISECGFSYRNNHTGTDQTKFAVNQLTRFYSYVNMIYPPVKAVFYFDRTISGEGGSYALAGNSSVASAYESVIAENGAYITDGQDSGKNWQSLSQFGEQKGEAIRLATYASFPGNASTIVTYYVDGNKVAASSQAPYYYTLDTAAFTSGTHTVRAEAVSGAFVRSTPTYEITVSGTASPSTSTQTPAEGLPLDTASGWAKSLIQSAEEKDLVTERNRENFQNQITRLQFADLAVNLVEQVTGKEIPMTDQVFKDTSDTMARKAVAAGIASGKGNGVFAPDASITRQEICVMLNKVIQYVDEVRGTVTLPDVATTMDAKFTDVDAIQSWAVESVAVLTNSGLMSGKDGGRVAPADNTKIEEAVALILALYNKF